MKKVFLVGFAGIVASLLMAGLVYSQSLDEIRAEVRAEVRREMSVRKPRVQPVVRRAEKPVVKSAVRQVVEEIGTGMSDETRIEVIRKVTLFMMGLALIPAGIAKVKGRSFIAWWILGLLCFIIVLPASIFMKKMTCTVNK